MSNLTRTIGQIENPGIRVFALRNASADYVKRYNLEAVGRTEETPGTEYFNEVAVVMAFDFLDCPEPRELPAGEDRANFWIDVIAGREDQAEETVLDTYDK